MRNAFRSALGPLIIICAMPAAAGDMDFISRHEEGWFFYNEKPEPEPAPKPKPEEEESTAALPAPPETIDASPGPIVLSSAWLRENLPRYLDAALDNPTIENVETYKRLERLAVDKATKFAELNHEVTLLYPDLDANTERSLSTAGAQDIDADNAVAAQAILESLSQFVGLLFFFNGDCRPCETQLALLNVCESCAATIETFMKKVQQLNQHFGNSCHLAQGILNDTVQAMGGKTATEASITNMVEGFTTDVFSAMENGVNSTKQLVDSDPDTASEQVTRNLSSLSRSLSAAKRGFSAAATALGRYIDGFYDPRR
ncbi:MAG: conjugal transfer protein TraF [Alphaproteobacteria bacterium]|nr:conjugal transfer protein TraF [Alphaproteobacteria bacterium]